MFICSASLVEDGRIWLLYSGTILFSIGTAMFRSTWFALLAPLLSGDQRVTFFATLRTSWKLCSLGFGFFIQMMLKLYDASVYLHLISLLIFLMIIQIVYYRKIPETIEDKNENSNLKFIDVIKKVLTDPRFSCILKIKFLIPLLTGSVALVFNLYEKNILGFTADEIMFMGNSIFSGSLLGFWVGAWVVKRYGEIVVFQWTTWAMMFLGILFSLMPYIVWSVLLHASMISFSLGMCLAVIGIAETTLMLKYLPEKLETVASSIWIAITQLGFACSGLIAAFFINKFLIEDKTISEFYHVYNFLLWAFVIPLPFFAIRYTRQLKSLTAE
jgi:hypothetical protein